MTSALRFNSTLHLLSVASLFLFVSCKTDIHGYYISNEGSDNNPGTKSRPFKTIEKVNSVQLKAGDKIFFKGDEEYKGTLKINAAGTKDSPLIISTYDAVIATINGGNDFAIIIKGSYFELRNIHAKGAGRENGNTTNGIQISESSNGYIDNIKTEGFQKTGLEVFSSTNIRVNKVQAFNNGFCGILISGSSAKRSKNISMTNCTAENNPGDPTALDNHSGNGILVGFSDSVLIDHCTATNNGWDMPRIGNGPVGIWAYESSYVTIQYCISYRNRTSKGGKDGGGFDLDGGVTNSVIQYCLSYENEGAGYGLFQYAGASLWNNDTVRYCISINDATTTEGSGGIFVWNGTPDSVQLADCFVYNNLVYSTHAPAVQFEPMSKNKNFNFFNNIFIGNGDIVHGPNSGERFLGNIWWKASSEISFKGFRSFDEWVSKTGQEKLEGKVLGKQIDPLIKGPFTTTITDPYQLHSLTAFSLNPQSPIKDQGLDLLTLFKIKYPAFDFFGNPIPKGKGIEPGIHEIQE